MLKNVIIYMVNNMKKYLSNYILETEELLKGKITSKDIENHINKINFFSHERLIHLLVTLSFALFTIIFIYMSITFQNMLLIVISLIMLIVLIFYIFHYYFLENSVQYLYKLYDLMINKIK